MTADRNDANASSQAPTSREVQQDAPLATGDAGRVFATVDQIIPAEESLPVVMTGLTNADFQRLGVDAWEVRHVVIRRAASRTTGPLAKRFLKQPNEKAERELTQIATSTYRLLDPRQRSDPSQQANIGRIRPNLIDWAGRTEFAIDHEADRVPPEQPGEVKNVGKRKSRDLNFLARVPLGSPDTVLPRSDAFSDPDNLAKSGLPIPTGIDLGIQNPLSRSLDSGDLVRDDFRRSPFRKFRFWLRQPRTLIGLIAILLMASGGMFGWMLRRQTVAFEPSALLKTQTETQIGWNTHPESITTAAAVDSVSTPIDLTPNVSTPIGGSMSAEDAAQLPIAIAEPVDDKPANVKPTIVESAEVEKTETPSTLEIDPTAVLALARAKTIASSRMLRQWFVVASEEVSTEWENSLTNLAAELQTKATLTPDVVEATDPTPAMQPAETRETSEPKRDFAKRMEAYSTGGNANFSAQEHLDRALAGLRLFDELLCSEQFGLAEQLSEHVRRHCAFSNEIQWVERLKNELAVAGDMEDMSLKIGDLMKRVTLSEASPSDAAIIGRYLCLFRRDWTQGAEWLQSVSDTRLSALAKQDNDLMRRTQANQSSRTEMADLASKWTLHSKRLSGREMDSIALRALHWYDSALTDTPADIDDAADRLSEVRLLAVRAERESLIASLPIHLRPVNEPFTKPVITTPPEPPLPIAKGPNLLHGTVRPIDLAAISDQVFDPDDVVLGFQYSPGLNITAAQWQQIKERVFADQRSLKLELSGVFKLTKPTDVEVVFMTTSPVQSQSIWIDAQPLTLNRVGALDGSEDSDDPSTTPRDGGAKSVVSLQPGEHSVRWTIVASQIDTVLLALVDAETDQAITVSPDPLIDLSKTRGMVSLLPNR